MSRMKLAAERLDQALQQLELAAAPLVNTQTKAREVTEKLKTLQAERDQLAGQVRALETRTEHLSALNAEAEGRLDSAITEIRAALGR